MFNIIKHGKSYRIKTNHGFRQKKLITILNRKSFENVEIFIYKRGHVR